MRVRTPLPAQSFSGNVRVLNWLTRFFKSPGEIFVSPRGMGCAIWHWRGSKGAGTPPTPSPPYLLGAHKISAKRVMGEGEGGGRLLVGECFTEGALIKLAHWWEKKFIRTGKAHKRNLQVHEDRNIWNGKETQELKLKKLYIKWQ